MDTLTSFSIIALAALIHASFQLGVSMVTLLASHATGKMTAPSRILRMTNAFLGGTLLATLGIVASLAYAATVFAHHHLPSPFTWTLACGLLIGIGVAVWAFYYRRGEATALWLPRRMASFIAKRISTTTLSAEAFSLGITSVVTELPFIVAPASAAALAIITLPVSLQLAGVAVYVLVACMSTSLVTVLIGSGHTLAGIQRWREHNRRFLQFAAGSALIVLGFYLYVDQVLTPSVLLAGAR